MVIGCMRLNDVTCYDVRHDSDRVTDVAKDWGWDACTGCTAKGTDFKLILTVKVETRHPIEGQIGREFPAICNHCGVMTA